MPRTLTASAWVLLLLAFIVGAPQAEASDPCACRGIVVAETGEPLPGARVFAYSELAVARRHDPVAGSDPLPREDGSAITDASGRFSVKVNEPGIYVLRVEAAGRPRTVHVGVPAAAGDVPSVRIGISSQARAKRGRVVDASGSPVAGAHVEADLGSAPSWMSALGNPVVFDDYVRATDAEGWWGVERVVYAGAFVRDFVAVSLPDEPARRWSTRSKDPAREFQQVLHRGTASLTLRLVRADGTAVPGRAVLTVTPDADQDAMVSVEATAGIDGQVTFDALPSGKIERIGATAEGALAFEGFPGFPLRDAPPGDIVLRGLPEVRGVVLGPTNKPVKGAWVALRDPGLGARGTSSDAQGKFTLFADPGLQIQAVAHSAGLVMDPDPSNGSGATPRVRMLSPIRIEGRVVDSSDRPVVGAYVLTRGPDLGTVTGEDGRFLIPCAPPGVHELTATDPKTEATGKTVVRGQSAGVTIRIGG